MWQRGKMPERVTILIGALGLAFAGVQLRLIQVQVLQAPRLRAVARSQQEAVITLDPKRGPIYDRNGKELALSVDVDSVYADPSQIANPTLAARNLSRVLGVRFEDLRAKLKSGKRFAWVQRKITPAQRRAVEALKIKGIGFVKESKRYYPNGPLAAHVLGYAGVDNQGLDGIEYSRDADVRGKPGRLSTIRDGRGGRALTTNEHPPTAGRSVVLSLDLVVQHLAEKELEAAVAEHQARGGTAIVLRPDTGEILALANRPTFDPNVYSEYSDESRRNRAIGAIYEPGSTFKVVTAGAALEEKKVTPATVLYCEHGAIQIGKFTIKEDRLPFDYLTVEQIVEKSSNVGAIKLALMMPPSVFYRHLTDFGFGESTGIDLPGETRGLLRPPESWSGLSQASLAIGQEVGVTPLQSVTAVSAVASGGILRRPWIVAGLVGEDGGISRPARSADPGRRIISPATAAAMTSILEKVVTDGTGKAAAIPGYGVAGKTGTAQKIDETGRYSRGKYVASFVGFVPSRDPALAIIVVVDEPHHGFHGGEIAAPVFARIALPALQYLGVMPAEGGVILNRGAEIQASLRSLEAMPSVARGGLARRRPKRAEQTARFLPLAAPELGGRAGGDSGSDEVAEMPDLSGMSLREATILLAQMGLTPHINGRGPLVGSQSPEPGAEVRSGEACSLALTEERP
ncbi:MAG TPA: penicillin-binding protein [Candidatus Polarisedimenticolia bacterium]|jgi:cell division protein FtsI (penicillin-binding protein 3)|nr:penicillin-binding protein [Candidatus Polarisedimenticolia bacterium]